MKSINILLPEVGPLSDLVRAVRGLLYALDADGKFSICLRSGGLLDINDMIQLSSYYTKLRDALSKIEIED